MFFLWIAAGYSGRPLPQQGAIEKAVVDYKALADKDD
jgi:hypothetical protein